MNSPTNNTPNLHALLIGIDCYLENRMPDGSFYPSLRGCVRDVTHMEDFLKSKFQIPQENILKLMASNVNKPEPPEPKSQWPTYENMVAAFKELAQKAQPGDHVLIHYSGHGGRAKTIYAERKGPNGIDEALVPTNIGKSEARYLRDLELAKIMNDMVAKRLVIAVMLDSCHSGGMTRGGGDVAVRGIGTVDDRKPKILDSDVGLKKELLDLWDQLTQKGTRNVALGSGWLPEPKGYTLLAACRPSESAYEFAFDGKERNGALTYWLLHSLQDAGPGMSYKALHDRIVAKVHSQFENQTPQLQGEGDRVFYGSDRVRPHYAVPVMKVDSAGKRLLLGAGQAHGLRKNAQFAIYPHGSDISKAELRQAVVEISQLGSTDSWASIVKQFGQKAIEQGAEAAPVGSAVRLLQKVYMVTQAPRDLPPNLDQKAALGGVEKALKDNGWLEVAEKGGEVDYNVAVNSKGEYEIWDRTGAVIKNLRPPIKVGAEKAGAEIARRLVHLAKYNAIKQLYNHDAMSPLARKLEIDLIGKRAEYDPADPFEPEETFADEPGRTPIMRVGQWTALRIKNASTGKLNITVVDLQPDWGISQIFPAGHGDYFVEFESGQEMIIPLEAGLPTGYEEGKDLIKVFATVTTSNFRWLELPALDQPLVRSIAVRGKAPANSLEELMSAFTADKPPTRNLVPAAYPSREWVVSQVEVNVKKAE